MVKDLEGGGSVKIAVSSAGSRLDSPVDSRFARCAYFIIYDTETNQWEAVENKMAFGRGGVGVKNSQFIVSKGCEAVITAGNVGPNALSVLRSSNIKIYAADVRSVGEAIKLFKEGKLKEI